MRRIVRKKRKKAPRVRMGAAFSQDMQCPACGMRYRDLRTGLTFSEVRAEFYVWNDDSSLWKNKRRSTVLGRWHSHKMQMWDTHVLSCDAVPCPF